MPPLHVVIGKLIPIQISEERFPVSMHVIVHLVFSGVSIEAPAVLDRSVINHAVCCRRCSS